MDFVSIREAAMILKCHPYSLYAAVYDGRVRAKKLRGNVRIYSDEVERLLKRKEKLDLDLSVNEVARILSCSQATVLRCIHGRTLRAELVAGRYRISPKDLENFVLSLPNV